MAKYTGSTDNVVMYVEPNNIQDSAHDNVPFNYEDYCLAVDLEVTIPNRYDCGIVNSMHFYSSDASQKISFLGGNNGMLTTTFTDISSIEGTGRGNKETLGIKSISIDYGNYYVPTVTVVFTDVRGTALMQPEEEGYVESLERGDRIMSQASFFRALFAFPFPMFKMTVKGFYGKPVTYHLALKKFNTSFDGNSGNFDVSVDFIGYMYGLYTDIPMNYILLAPYCRYKGAEYWIDNIGKNGKFRVDNSPMPRLLDLANIIRGANTNIRKDLATSRVAKQISHNDAVIFQLEKILSAYKAYTRMLGNPLKVEVDGIIYYFVQKKEENNKISTAWHNLKETIDKFNNEYPKNKYNYAAPDIALRETIPVAYNYSGPAKETFNDDNRYTAAKYNASNWEIIVPNETNPTPEICVEVLNRCKSSVVKNTTEIFNANSLCGFVYDTQNFWNRVSNDILELKKSNEKLNAELSGEYDTRIQEALGFKPTVKNIVKIIFAHLETFMEMFYQCTGIIKSSQRTFKTMKLSEGATDVNAVNSTMVPPFPLILDRTESKVIYPEDSAVGLTEDDMEELKLVNELINAAYGYTSDLTSAGTNFDFLHSLTSDIFIPLNPYKKLSYGTDNIMSDIVLTFANRLLTYISFENLGVLNGETGRKNYPAQLSATGATKNSLLDSFAITEAYNIYRANKWNSFISGTVKGSNIGTAAYDYIAGTDTGLNEEVKISSEKNGEQRFTDKKYDISELKGTSAIFNTDSGKVYTSINPLYKFGIYTNSKIYADENGKGKYDWTKLKAPLHYDTVSELQGMLAGEDYNSFDTALYENGDTFLPFDDRLSEAISRTPVVYALTKDPNNWIDKYTSAFNSMEEDIRNRYPFETKDGVDNKKVFNYAKGVKTENSRFYSKTTNNGTTWHITDDTSSSFNVEYNKLINNSKEAFVPEGEPNNTPKAVNDEYKDKKLRLSKLCYSNGKVLCGSPLYLSQRDERARAALFLQSCPLDFEYILNNFPESYTIAKVPIAVPLFIGSLIDYGQYGFLSGNTYVDFNGSLPLFLDDKYQFVPESPKAPIQSSGTTGEAMLARIEKLRLPVQKVLVDYFEAWVDGRGDFQDLPYSWPAIRAAIELYPWASEELRQNIYRVVTEKGVEPVISATTRELAETTYTIEIVKKEGDKILEILDQRAIDKTVYDSYQGAYKAAVLNKMYPFNSTLGFKDEDAETMVTPNSLEFWYDVKNETMSKPIIFMQQTCFSVGCGRMTLTNNPKKYFLIEGLDGEKTEGSEVSPVIRQGYEEEKLIRLICKNGYGADYSIFTDYDSGLTEEEKCVFFIGKGISYFVEHNELSGGKYRVHFISIEHKKGDEPEDEYVSTGYRRCTVELNNQNLLVYALDNGTPLKFQYQDEEETDRDDRLIPVSGDTSGDTYFSSFGTVLLRNKITSIFKEREGFEYLSTVKTLDKDVIEDRIHKVINSYDKQALFEESFKLTSGKTVAEIEGSIISNLTQNKPTERQMFIARNDGGTNLLILAKTVYEKPDNLGILGPTIETGGAKYMPYYITGSTTIPSEETASGIIVSADTVIFTIIRETESSSAVTSFTYYSTSESSYRNMLAEREKAVTSCETASADAKDKKKNLDDKVEELKKFDKGSSEFNEKMKEVVAAQTAYNNSLEKKQAWENLLSAIDAYISILGSAARSLGYSPWVKDEYFYNNQPVKGAAYAEVRVLDNSERESTRLPIETSDVKTAVKNMFTALNNFYTTNLIKYKQFGTSDIRLSAYLLMKNLYDKWLCGIPKKMWDINEPTGEFNRFKFMDSYYNDISLNLLVDVEALGDDIYAITRANDPSPEVIAPSMYSFLQHTNEKSGCIMIESPALGSYDSMPEFIKIFKPMPFSQIARETSNSPAFLWIYPHEGSRYLAIDESQYKDDGFEVADINGTITFPTELCNNDPISLIPAFGVSFGKQNQSLFKGFKISMDNAQMTDISIANTIQIADNFGKNPATTSYMSQDLFRNYANKWYSITVDMLGDASISPLMYFQLNNVPMFRGTYRITKVTHNISAGQMTTSFTGVRMSSNKMPMLNSPLIVSDIAKKGNNDNPDKETVIEEVVPETYFHMSYEDMFHSMGANAKGFETLNNNASDNAFFVLFKKQDKKEKTSYADAYNNLADETKKVLCSIAYSMNMQFKGHRYCIVARPEDLAFDSSNRRIRRCDRCYGEKSEHGNGINNASKSESFILSFTSNDIAKGANDSNNVMNVALAAYDMIANLYGNYISCLNFYFRDMEHAFIEVTAYEGSASWKTPTLGCWQIADDIITLDTSGETTIKVIKTSSSETRFEIPEITDTNYTCDEVGTFNAYLSILANLIKNQIQFACEYMENGCLLKVAGDNKTYIPLKANNKWNGDASDPFTEQYTKLISRI